MAALLWEVVFLLWCSVPGASSFPSHHHARNLRDYQSGFGAGQSLPGYTVHNYSQTLDHFNFQQGGNFEQRYLLINAGNYTNGSSTPIFVFTGAEGGNVENVIWAYTFMINVAMEINAMVVCLEHRFFGLSIPFGNNATEALRPQADRVGLLSVEQALADYSQMITMIRDDFDAWGAPVVTFGGSLAGTLASFMRLKYPQLVDIAVASSAPIRGYPGLMNQFAWHKQVTDNYEHLVPGCSQVHRSTPLQLSSIHSGDRWA
jgi:lysosomal Pro-X carboxypeptidase